MNEPHRLVRQLTELRYTRRIPQRAVAAAAGLERHTLSDVEVGRTPPMLATLTSYAEALGRRILAGGRSPIEAIRAARRSQGMSQLDLAIAAGVQQTTVSLIETGRAAPKVATVERCLRVLGLELEVEAAPASPGVSGQEDPRG